MRSCMASSLEFSCCVKGTLLCLLNTLTPLLLVLLQPLQQQPTVHFQLLLLQLLLLLSPSDTSFAYFKGVENSDIDISNCKCLVVYLSVLIP